MKKDRGYGGDLGYRRVLGKWSMSPDGEADCRVSFESGATL